MQRDDLPSQSAPTTEKRVWRLPTIVDEDIKNTELGKASGAETPTTTGPVS